MPEDRNSILIVEDDLASYELLKELISIIHVGHYYTNSGREGISLKGT